MSMDVFDQMAVSWKAPVVARAEIGKFSGGALNPKTLANMDCEGTGPSERLVIGRRVCYPTPVLVAWMRKHSRAAQ